MLFRELVRLCLAAHEAAPVRTARTALFFAPRFTQGRSSGRHLSSLRAMFSLVGDAFRLDTVRALFISEQNTL